MRILIAGTTYYPALNGQAIFTINLAEGLAKRGHQVTVLFPESHNFSRRRNGVQLEAVGSMSLTFIHTGTYVPVFFGKRVRRVFDSFQPEVIHIQDHYPLSKFVVNEAKTCGLKIIGTNHFSPINLTPYMPALPRLMPFYDRNLWNWMMRVYNRLDLVTAPSRSAVELMLEKGLKVPAFPLSCGTDLTHFHPDSSIDRVACRLKYGLNPDKTIFLFVGRVDQEKRIDVLLQALQHVKRDDIQLAIAGNGAALRELKSLARKLNLGNLVRFTNYVRNEELHSLLNSVDVFMMASDHESLSIASLEAMACGLPLLLADASALADLVAPGINGYLFKPGDAKDAACYMEMLTDQRDQRNAMGKASLIKVQSHRLENTIQAYENFYQSL